LYRLPLAAATAVEETDGPHGGRARAASPLATRAVLSAASSRHV